jgi:hypothetical protein
MATLVYLGGASLTFGSGTGRQIVKRGEPFEASAELAKILLADPHVSPADAVELTVVGTAKPTAPAPARAHSTSGLDAIKALRARAKELGIPATGTAKHLSTAIAAAEKRQVAAPSVVKADAPPAPGAITLGDLPPSAKVGGS